jgi:AraC family transcriptional regulator of adaptative response / DNA-3-methyladenine glycosylase II
MMAAMTLGDDAAYLALKTHDARFDGRLFVGVRSTGVYCRPVCRVRTPLRRNCRFYPNAASAERDGFRPCLRCRPELAPGLSLVDSSAVLAQHAARLIEQAARGGETIGVPAVAARLGITDRHLRRIFRRAIGVSPIDYLSTQRLLLAKQLLTDTALPVTQVALASGHGSVRRFNAAFAAHYRMNPSALRRRTAADGDEGRAAAAEAPRLRLAYRPPYDHEGMLRFLAQRALPSVEAVHDLELRRTLRWTHQGRALHGWLQARFVPDRHELQVTLAPALLPAAGAVLQRLRLGFDLDADPAVIDPVLARLPVAPRPGLRLPGAIDGFETAARVVLGQQVSVAAARTLAQRLVAELGEPVATPLPGLDRLFPSAAAVAAADPARIGRLGIVRQRVRALQALAQAVAEGRLELDATAPLEPTLRALQALPGIGEWTAQLIGMRVLAWPDAFPPTDIGVLNALGTRDPAAAAARAEAWRPWRAYAVIRLWQTLET